MKSVQISEELFLALIKYHCLDIDVDFDIEKSLNDKLDKLVLRELYSQYKDSSLTNEERESARLSYLDHKGIHKDFRW